MALFPLVTNGWGTKYLISDMAPALLAKEEGPATKKELDLVVICARPFPHPNNHGQTGFHHLPAQSVGGLL
jgi:hypothetical protein